VPVAVLSGTIPVERAILIENDIILPISDLADARDINHVAQTLRRKARVQIKVDTGMGRLGINLPEAHKAIRLIAGMDKLELSGICSHFPLSSEGGEGFTNRQIKEFTDLLSKLAEEGITFKWRHIANSDAICNFPAAFQPPFNMVRSGINLYGAFNQNNIDKLQLEPAVSFKSRLIAVRDLPAGSNIGYGLQCQLNDRTSVGIVAAGYADGVPLALSGKGNVLIRGTVCPILGRISMDYTAVSLAALPTAQVGDEVVLLGSSGKYQIGVQEWAHYKNTHPYEILCSFGTRARRCYIDDRQPANDSGMFLAESRLS
jgi:alanine racemase